MPLSESDVQALQLPPTLLFEPPQRPVPPVEQPPTPTGILDPRNRTDIANAERLASIARGSLLYCREWKQWLGWDGVRYRPNETAAEWTKAVAREVWAETFDAVATAGNEDRKWLLRFAADTASSRGSAAMLTMARSDPQVSTAAAQLNTHSRLFNVANGTLDLRTGTLLPHDRAHRLTQLCPHRFDPVATCPIWLAMLAKIFSGNAAIIGFIRRLLGSAMLGNPVDDVLVILYGLGANGKSTLLEALLHVLGDDYATKAPSELLLASRHDRHPAEKVVLFGKRLVLCSETDEGRRLNESLVKELTGRDTISARGMKQNFWTFRPTHTLLLATNHVPTVSSDGDAIWRRLRLVPFHQRFWSRSKGESGPPELEADGALSEKLRAESPGILAWLVAACLEYQRDGLGQPTEVTAATAGYRQSQDVLGEWLRECGVLEEGARTPAATARKSYAIFCEDHGHMPVSGRRFGQFILSLPRVSRVISNGTHYLGLFVQPLPSPGYQLPTRGIPTLTCVRGSAAGNRGAT